MFPADPNLIGLVERTADAAAEALAPRLGLGDLPEYIDFPVGSMFWMRAAALEPIVALGLDWADYPPEPVAYDGTLLHALERLFPLVAESRGMEVAVTHMTGLTR